MRIFLYAGIAFLVAGAFFVIPNVSVEQPTLGIGFVLGCILLLIGVILIALTLPTKNRSKNLVRENQLGKLSVSRTQLTVALIIGGIFIAGFVLVYPGGFLQNYFTFVTPTVYPSQLFQGLERQYEVGDTLAFSLQPGGCWWDTEELPQTTIRRTMDSDGNANNKIIWRGTVTLETPPECANEGNASLRTTYFEGTFKPIVLEEAGVYEVFVEVDNPEAGKAQFRVVDG